MVGGDTPGELFSRRSLLRAAAAIAVPVAMPPVTVHAARLRVSGLVRVPLDVALPDLRRLGGETVTAVLECACSGRVSNARWGGVSLDAVLARAGVFEGATGIVLRGRDGHRRAIGCRDLFMARPLLAWERDGVALTAESGGPLRLIVPGWVAEASVKQLVAIDIVDRLPAAPPPLDPTDRRLRPLREMPPRAVIDTPISGGAILAGPTAITGRAWSGHAPIAAVAVSVDGGLTWRDAEIVERTGPQGWTRFRAMWHASPGSALLAARATDAFGLRQPLALPSHARGFVFNAVASLPVTVRFA